MSAIYWKYGQQQSLYSIHIKKLFGVKLYNGCVVGGSVQLYADQEGVDARRG